VLVVFDEAYYEYVDAPNYPNSLQYVREGRPNVMVLRSFSKGYGLAGIRLGCGIAHSDLLAPLHASAESFPVNRLAQAAGVAALGDGEFVRRSVQVNQQGRQYLYSQFERLELHYVPSYTNFVLVEIGPAAAAVIQSMLEQGVIVRPCAGYDLPHFARVTIGTPEQNARLVRTLETALERQRQPTHA
jgi:histidinol-phosphate aminotransferase